MDATAGRRAQIVEAARDRFAAHGPRRTQMADIARDLGVAQGTLYNHVESKELLLLLAVDLALGGEVAPPELDEQQLVERISGELQRLSGFAGLARALDADEVADVSSEVEQLLRELFDAIERLRQGASLLERAAAELPALASLWFDRHRELLFDGLAAYIERRRATGHLPEGPPPELAARFVAEALTWFARHRHGDPTGRLLAADEARQVAVEMGRRALVCGGVG